MWEEFLNTQRQQKLNTYFPECETFIYSYTNLRIFNFGCSKCLLVRDTTFQENPSTGNCDKADMIHCYASQVSLILVRLQPILHHM
jgi:hypothetical protein